MKKARKAIKILTIIIGNLIGFVFLNDKIIMKNNKPVWTFESTTILSIADIETILFEITDGEYQSDSLPFILRGKSSCKIVKDGSRFIILFEDGHKEYVIIDKANHKLTTQGEWWYQGIYSLHLQGDKKLIRLNVYNVAEKQRWAAALMILPKKYKHKGNFIKFVADLESEFTKRQKKGSR
jgi:hypothetical protein